MQNVGFKELWNMYLSYILQIKETVFEQFLISFKAKCKR